MSNPVNSNPVANLTVSATYVVCNLPVLVCIFAFIFCLKNCLLSSNVNTAFWH